MVAILCEAARTSAAEAARKRAVRVFQKRCAGASQADMKRLEVSKRGLSHWLIDVEIEAAFIEQRRRLLQDDPSRTIPQE